MQGFTNQLPQNNSVPVFMTVRQIVKMKIGISEQELRRRIRYGRVPFIKVGNRAYIDINGLIEQLLAEARGER